jgi:hypothetical protein
MVQQRLLPRVKYKSPGATCFSAATPRKGRFLYVNQWFILTRKFLFTIPQSDLAGLRLKSLFVCCKLRACAHRWLSSELHNVKVVIA